MDRRAKSKTHAFTTLVLPKPLHARLKKAAIDEDRHEYELVEDAIRHYLDRHHQTPSLRSGTPS